MFVKLYHGLLLPKDEGKHLAITLNSKPGSKNIELGGGSHPLIRPNVDIRQAYDEQGNPTVDFTANFEEPLPITSEEWDGVYSSYCLEHVSWRKLGAFLSEVYRILKPGGKAVFVTANTQAQIKYIQEHPEGWDGKNIFESASCVLFGDQDYSDNTHKSYFSPEILRSLFTKAGFLHIEISPYGARDTDIVVQALKPTKEEILEHSRLTDDGNPLPASYDRELALGDDRLSTPERSSDNDRNFVEERSFPPDRNLSSERASSSDRNYLSERSLSREQLFDKVYFNGGTKVGGYAHEGYRDFGIHEVTFRHVLARKPESILELGCGRGYLLKRFQDAGIPSYGVEISQHCYLTRVATNITQWDICKTPWWLPQDKHEKLDLCFSQAFLEHIPEEFLPAIVESMKIQCKRGLHGIDFGEKDSGFDKTHVTLKSKTYWETLFALHDFPCEVVDKEELERGEFPREVLVGDGSTKLNLGCFLNQFHHGWLNIDIHDLSQYAQHNGYKFLTHDLRQGLPFPTQSVDMIYLCHVLEHFSAKDGLSLLRECRRVIKPDGLVRIIVPDARLLMEKYFASKLDEFNEISDGCENSPTQAGKLWELLHAGHENCHDVVSLGRALSDSGFLPVGRKFREIPSQVVPSHKEKFIQMNKETLDFLPCISLYVDGVPLVS